ncbi:MAG TPA: type IV pilus assembly protein PilM [Gaiellaceae bacterium]|nr:type IV pilus assembly protein PilM [Gaiellaceae bacterium]
MSESIWKKEITLRRKPKAVPEPKPAKESIWKKEISFGRKRKPAPETPVLAFDLAPAAEAVWSRPPEPEPEPEPELPVAQLHVDTPPPVEEPARWSEPERERPTMAEPVAWSSEPEPVEQPHPNDAWLARPEYEAEANDDTPPPVEEPMPVVPFTASVHDDVPHWSQPQQEVEVLPQPTSDAWLARAEYPPQLEPELPEVQATEPEPEPEPKTSFWRKERSLKRAPKEPELAVELPEAPLSEPEPKTSFWRKERSLKRAPKEPELAVEPVPVQAHEPEPKKTPFWQKRRAPKEPKQPKAERGDSFLRRERSLTRPKMSVPKRASGAAGGSGGHAVKRYVGLKVGGSQIAAARVANNGAAELLQVAREPLAQGVVVNGELRDPDALADALKRFFARNKLPRKNVRLGIASNRIGVRVFDIAGIDDERQLDNAIRFRAQDTLPIPLDEAVLDYHILGESVDENGNAARRVLLVVAYRDLVDRYVAACRKAGISLVGIDLEAFALLRALAAPKPADQGTDAAFVAVAIGHDRSTFAVSNGRVCDFTRVIEWGGSSLSVAVARALDMAPSEVESIKRLVSLESETAPEGIEPADYARAVDAVQRQVQGFARELVSSLQFYQHQPGSLGIGEIVITGGTTNLAGLAGELERLIGVRVRVGDPLARMKVGKKVLTGEQIGSLAVAIGLGIED